MQQGWPIFGGVSILKLQPTEGWECNLGFGRLESFFANNGLGGFLGPKWKVFHHGTPRKHFQGVGIACGSRPRGEKLAEKGQKISQTFLPLKDAIYTQSRWQIDGHENSSSYMPKNPPEVVFKPSFLVKMCPFFSIFC